MIKIDIPNNFIEERTYIIDVIFGYFLGLRYIVEPVSNNDDCYYVRLSNDKQIIIEDHFFSTIHEGMSYLHENNIPAIVKFIKSQFLAEDDIPVIFGNDDNPIGVNGDTLRCKIDIFSSSFFMLTRWEEYVNKAKDGHGRFPAHESLACKYNFLGRPIVNEYVELLWNMLKTLDPSIKRKDRKFCYFITHDIDIPTIKLLGIYKVFKKIVFELFFRRDFSAAASLTCSWVCEKILHFNNDIYVNYDWLMSFSESLLSESRFYFMASDQSKYDPGFNDDSLKLASHYSSIIAKRGHKIGYHPSYVSFDKNESWNAELTFLRTIIRSPISGGRQHYLRFEVPKTWQIWSKNGLGYDSSLGYAEIPGFRCGTCYEYPVFDFLTKQRLDLLEYPLIVMDSSIFKRGYNKTSFAVLKKYITICKKFNGNFVFLLHNTEPITKKRKELINSAFIDE